MISDREKDSRVELRSRRNLSYCDKTDPGRDVNVLWEYRPGRSNIIPLTIYVNKYIISVWHGRSNSQMNSAIGGTA